MSIFRIKTHSIKVGYRVFFNNLKSLVKAIASGNIFKGQKVSPSEIRINDEFHSSLYTAKKILPEIIDIRENVNITIQTMFIAPVIGFKIIKEQFEEILTTKVN